MVNLEVGVNIIPETDVKEIINGIYYSKKTPFKIYNLEHPYYRRTEKKDTEYKIIKTYAKGLQFQDKPQFRIDINTFRFELKTKIHDKKEKKFPELKEGLTFSIGEQSGGGEVTAKITKVENGKYTIDTYTKDEHKGSHTFGVKEIKELIEEGGFKIKKSSESDLEWLS